MPESASGRFARAVEGEPIEPPFDERLRHELAVVAALREVGGSARLDDVARQRMRRKVLAEFVEAQAMPPGRAVQPQSSERTKVPVQREVSAQRPARPAATGLRGRLLVAAAATLCLLMSLSGMSLLLARDALPGDALYGVKRSAESAELGLTFGLDSRGFKHLQFATARVDEMEALAARTGGAVPAADADRYRTALQAFDTDAAAGSRLLIQSATNGDGSMLAALHGWALQQRQRIETATAAMPKLAAARSAESLALLTKVAERTSALQARLRCLSVTSGASDNVGLLPADGTCVPVPVGSTSSQTPLPNGGNRLPAADPSQQASSPVEQTQTPPLDPLAPRDGNAPAQPPLLPVPDPADPTGSTLIVPLPILPPLLSVPPLAPGLPTLRVG